MWRRCSGQTCTRSSSRIVVPLARSSVTMRSSCTVFHRTTALDSRLRQLALFMIDSYSEVRNSPWLAKNSHLARPCRASPRVELGLDAQAERLVMQIAQNVAGLHQPAEGGERLGDTIAGTAGGQSLQHDMGRRGARLQRRRNTDQLVPLFGDRDRIGIAGEQAGERVGNPAVVDAPEPLIGQVPETRHE